MAELSFSTAERSLLCNLAHAIGPVIASPEYELALMADGTRSGGGAGFDYQFTNTAIVGTWHEFIEAAWYPDGSPFRWRFGELLGEARISYKRLARWVESLPAATRAQAVVWWRMHPERTRDLAALHHLTLTALGGVPAEQPEPTDLLELLEMTNA